MLSKFKILKIAQKTVLKDCRPNVRFLQKRWLNESTKSTSSTTPKLAYLRNDGESPLLETTIGRLLESAAEKWPNRDCVVSMHQKNARLTYSQLLSRADRLAAGFKQIGMKKGDRIGIWGPNSLEWMLAYMASTRAGLIVAGINPFYQLDEVEYCVRKIGAKAVVAPLDYREQNYARMLLQVKKTSPSLEHVVIYSDDHVAGTRRMSDVEQLAAKIDVEAVKEEQVEISPHCGTNIQFTSGTTGQPKATLLAHRSLANNSRQAVTRLQLKEAKVCLNVPFFHAFGMIMGVTGPLHVGSTIVLESATFNPVKSIETIAREKCNVTFGTPTMWINMIDAQMRTGTRIDTLLTGSVGGAPVSPDLYKAIRKHLRMEKIKSIYGLTEITAICNQSLPEESNELTESTVGYISDHIEIKVIDDEGATVPFGTPGELCVKGYSTMMGYWADEESTSKTLTDDGWLKSGDQYVLREDGYGIIVGRIKDMLIRGGENIFPKEIEHFLESHPDIMEAQVFGVHDDVYGEEICASIRLRENSKLTKEDIAAYAKGKIARFKIPKYYDFRDKFPKTTSGKIQKFKLKQELEDTGIVPKVPKY